MSCNPETFKPLDAQASDAAAESSSEGKFDIDTVQSWMLQVFSVLLIIFVMASVLFRVASKAEIAAIKKEFGKWIPPPDPANEARQHEETLIKLQLQILLNALDRVEEEYRKELALSIFSKKRDDGSVWFDVAGVLAGEKVSDQHFIRGCRFAKENLPFREKVYQDWLFRVLTNSGSMLEATAGMSTNLRENLQVLVEANKEWLFQQIRKRVGVVCNDTCEMQRAALAQLQLYYQSNISALKGTPVHGLVEKYLLARPEEQEQMIPQIRNELYSHIKSIFEKQGVSLLNDV